MTKIQAYIDLLKDYNQTTNIFSKNAYDKLDFHINDCLTLSSLVQNTTRTIFDFGSGSGLPSIPLAITHPAVSVIAIESKSRKTNFLNHVKTELKLTNLKVVTKNLFEWKTPSKPDIITAKAFAPLDKINRLYSRFKGKNTFVLIPISQNQAEIYKIEPNITIIEKNSFLYAKLQSN